MFAVVLALVAVAGEAQAADVAQRAVAYAQKVRDDAAAMVAVARDRVAAAEADVQLASRVDADARLAGDREAMAVAGEAVTMAAAGVRDARQLLQRATALLAARSKTADDMHFWLDAKTPPRALLVPVEGDVRRYAKDGTAITEGSGMLRPGERVETGKGATARLFVAGGDAEVALAESTEFVVTQDAPDTDFEGLLNNGFMRMRAWVRAKGRKFEVRTPSAVTSVRGTDFAVATAAGGDRVQVFDGVVAVTPGAGGEAVLVHAGEELFMSPAAPWPAPQAFDAGALPAPWEKKPSPR